MFASILFISLVGTPQLPVRQWVCGQPGLTPSYGLLTFNASSSTFSFKTKDRTAAGRGVAEVSLYRGVLTADKGATFAFTLDRSTGNIKVTRASASGAQTTEYAGHCTESRSLPSR